MKIYQRKNRKTRGIIELHHERDFRGLALWLDFYWCECEHGKRTRKTTQKTEAIRDMAHPDEWCKECAILLQCRKESKMRFVLIEGNSEFPNDGETCWYWDTRRPLKDDQPFVAVQCYCGIDPNDFVPIEGLRLLFTDQAEYYAVCPSCYFVYANQQWSGSTQSFGWRKQSQDYLKQHQQEKGWCEFCDPVFGNGGWV